MDYQLTTNLHFLVSNRIQSEKAGDKGEHCLSSYAGITPTVGADPKFWVAEIILHVLRWEGEVLGSRFSLPTDDDE